MSVTIVTREKHKFDKSCLFNEHISSKPSNFAKKQLEKMGWKEGEGLGKDKQGLKEHIKVGFKESEIENENDKWWIKLYNQTVCEDNKVDKIKEISDEELFKACGCKRLGMRARMNQEGKWKRIEEAEKKMKKESEIKKEGDEDVNDDESKPKKRKHKHHHHKSKEEKKLKKE